MTDDHKYGPWIAFNGGPKPVADGVKVQVQLRSHTRVDAESCPHMTKWSWDLPRCDGAAIIAYRVLLEPETVTLWTHVYHRGYLVNATSYRDKDDNLRITYQFIDGGPDWSTARIEEIRE